ncbi:MalY/PatB family protein [Anaeromicrobium sediminis]|uniref:cysteine-S-conjugate beta-lyase n=1 Tax=Anaeromicrobium sediminis TaxID=1478221 RepID=A0A267M8D8_9FIRM|nr:MalY/PatB family protein [Anaeromicrobium sediminis]PAB55844.1 cystathionine beta-lyase [Anaeromicrobium sediminis]
MKYNFDEIVDRRHTHSVKWNPSFIKAMFGDKELLPLWVADMDFKCPQPIIDAAIETAKSGIYGYSERTEPYYNAVINWYKKRQNWTIEKDSILFSPGVVPALYYAIQTFCRPGDKVVIQNPVYYPFLSAIVDNGCHPVYNQLQLKEGKYVMDFEDLENKVKDPKVKLLLLCSPHNPVGRVWTEEELKKLGNICIENNVLIVSDEIHSDLIYKGYKHVPFASISDSFAQNSIMCTAPSKTFNIAGLQVSNIIVPNKIIRQELASTLEKTTNKFPNIFGLVACTAAYEKGEEWLEQLLDYLEDNLNFIDKFLKEKMPEVKLIRPEATYLAWLDFNAVESDEKKLENIIQKKAKVALDEGYIFGKGGEGFERINFACPRSILKEALERIERAIHN